eukprot:scaffold2578_cov136-Skeletonema_menzelii.AAC.6
MAAEAAGGNIVWFTYTGAVGEVIPRDATHVIVGKFVTVILAAAFEDRPNIEVVICHDKVERIEQDAFLICLSLRRVIMPGVKIVEEGAFRECIALTDVECGKLEIIEEGAFGCCTSLRSINLPSARIVGRHAFNRCIALTAVQFGSRLQRFDEAAFYKCSSLEQITIQLKDGLFPYDDIFQECGKLMHVDLVEGELHETIAALQLEDWRKNMKEEIDSINQILPNADAGYYHYEDGDEDFGEKAGEVRRWIRSVLSKIIHYQEEHHRLLDEEVAPTLQLALPKDIAMNNVLPFLALPPHTFEVGDEGEEEDSDDEVLSADSFVEEEEEE